VANMASFRGKSPEEMRAWLREILAHTLVDELRKATAQVRDVQREKSIEAAVESSSARLEEWLADGSLSPHALASREEELIRLAHALGKLPQDQRTAVELSYFQEYTLDAIAQQMGRSKKAVSALIMRGIRKLRELMAEAEPADEPS
jgi:RNA polymerase sigma-70 factor (ECF subfamily)